MKPIKTIDGTLSSRFPFGLHANLYTTIYTLVKPIPPAKLLLEESDITTWNGGILEEMEIDREAKKAEETAELQKKDDARDEIASALIQEIRLAAKSPIAENRAPGHRLQIIVDTYKGITRENFASETAHLKALLNDLDKPAAAADLATIGQTKLVQMLRTANEEFNAMYIKRLDFDASIKNLPAGKAVRLKNDKMMAVIFRHIETAYMMAATDDDRKLVSELIDRINAAIHKAKTVYNTSGKKKGSDDPSKPKEPKEPKQPKEPKTPKDPKQPEKPGGGSGEQPKKPDEKPKDPKKPDDGNPDITLPEE